MLHPCTARLPGDQRMGSGEAIEKYYAGIPVLNMHNTWANRSKTRHYGCRDTAAENANGWCGLMALFNGCGVTGRDQVR
jgi:hypothetical protein